MIVDSFPGHLLGQQITALGQAFDAHSGAVVLHRALVRTESLVGANALVPGGMEVPSRAMALGVPAKLRPDSVVPDIMIDMGAATYLERQVRYRKELRRLD